MAERPLGTVLVTGAASGLGAATALAVAAAGGRALALDRVAPPPEVAGAVADVELVDLADARAAEAAVRAVADRAGGLDAVFTPAGTDRCGTLAEVDGRRLGPGRAGQPRRHRGGGAGGPAVPDRVARHGRHLRVHAGLAGAVGRDGVLRVEVRRGRLHPGARGRDCRARSA